MKEYIEKDLVMDTLLHEQYGYCCEDAINKIHSADVVPWEWLERYADYFCAGVSMPEFIREAKMFYESTNKAMQGGVIDG